MFDTKKLLDQFLGGEGVAPTGGQSTDGQSTGGGLSGLGGLGGGALAGGLAALLVGTKTGRKVGKKALTYGGSALVGGLAYKAWRDWQAGKQASLSRDAETPIDALQPPPADSAFVPEPGQENSLNRSLIRAMIGAANADGRIDATEQSQIFNAVNELGLDNDEKAFVMDEFASPADVDAVAAGATCPETAAEIYAASLIAIDASGNAERAYLARLSERLGLEPGLVAHLHANVG